VIDRSSRSPAPGVAPPLDVVEVKVDDSARTSSIEALSVARYNAPTEEEC
jgi:hypothetical protein